MCQIKATKGAHRVSRFCNSFKVVPLTGVIVYTTHHHTSHFISSIFDSIDDILVIEGMSSGFWSQFDNGIVRVETMHFYLSFNSVLVGGEGSRFHDNFVALSSRAIKRNQQ